MLDIEAGEWIVSTNVSDDANDNVNGKGGIVDCEVYDSEDNAFARQAALLALADRGKTAPVRACTAGALSIAPARYSVS